MGVYVEIDDILDLFDSSDWGIDAKETIRDALHDGKLNTILLTPEEIKFLQLLK